MSRCTREPENFQTRAMWTGPKSQFSRGQQQGNLTLKDKQTKKIAVGRIPTYMFKLLSVGWHFVNKHFTLKSFYLQKDCGDRVEFQYVPHHFPLLITSYINIFVMINEQYWALVLKSLTWNISPFKSFLLSFTSAL